MQSLLCELKIYGDHCIGICRGLWINLTIYLSTYIFLKLQIRMSIDVKVKANLVLCSGVRDFVQLNFIKLT